MSRYYIAEPTAAASPAPDYTTGVTSIGTELNSIDIDTTTIAAQIILMVGHLSTMAANSTTVANKLTEIETYQQRIKELAEGTGIHFVGPWEWVGLLSLYKLFIEEGKILEEGDNVSAEKLAQALAKFNQYKDKVNSLPTLF